MELETIESLVKNDGNRGGKLSVTNLSWENNFANVSTECSSRFVISAKVKKCEQTMLFIAMHYCTIATKAINSSCLFIPFHF